MNPLIDVIVQLHRKRKFLMDQRKRMHLSVVAFLRRSESSSLFPGVKWEEIPTADRSKIATNALKMAKGVEEDHPDYALIAGALASREPFEKVEADLTKKMEKAAKRLPVASWAKEINGFGERSLAVIIGEAGDLSNYDDKTKLWKRMGLAVMDGVRQGGLRKTATAEDWIVHGYNAKRRSEMFVIGDSLLKQQIRKVKDDDGEDTGERMAIGPYGEAYLARKAYERARAEASGLTVVPAAKIPRKNAELFMSDGHVHLRAQRYMEKQLLRDLWKAWRATDESHAFKKIEAGLNEALEMAQAI